MIKFNIPLHLGTEDQFVMEAVQGHHIGGDGLFSQKCSLWIQEKTKSQNVILTTSCSTALDMAAMLCRFNPGDEVILPSFTFPTTASSLAHQGVRLVFVDIRPDTMNIDEKHIESAITNKTKAIMVMHYAGISCEMDTIMAIAAKHGLLVIEDAAQGLMSSYKDKALGSIGDFGCFSFHETKNYTMGEGGALLIKNNYYNDRADNIKDSGTDRQGFLKGKVSAYSWVELGSSYMPSELSTSYLYGQLINAEEVNQNRLVSWNRYYDGLISLQGSGKLELPTVPSECTHNAHMFYIKTRDEVERKALISHLKSKEIQAVFHYIPLHSSLAGQKYGIFRGEDTYTTKESLRLLRLPMYYGIKDVEVEAVVQAIFDFYR